MPRNWRKSASLEDVAALLWECSTRRITDAPAVPFATAQWAAWLKLWGDSTPLDRALVLLPAAAAQMPRAWALGRDAQLDTAWAVMRLAGRRDDLGGAVEIFAASATGFGVAYA